MAPKVEKYPRETQYFKTWVSSFYFFPCSSSSRFISSFFDLKTRSSNHPPSVQSSNQPDRLTQHSIVQSTYCLFVPPLVFGAPDRASTDLFFLCSSLDMMFFKYKNRVLETRFCFLELESLKLEIYVVSYCQLTKWESSL